LAFENVILIEYSHKLCHIDILIDTLPRIKLNGLKVFNHGTAFAQVETVFFLWFNFFKNLGYGEKTS